jgi:hypothetical protein
MDGTENDGDRAYVLERGRGNRHTYWYTRY